MAWNYPPYYNFYQPVLPSGSSDELDQAKTIYPGPELSMPPSALSRPPTGIFNVQMVQCVSIRIDH